MKIDYSAKGNLKINMKDNIQERTEDFPMKLEGNAKTPWNKELFKVNRHSPKLNMEKKIFTQHSYENNVFSRTWKIRY